MRETIGAAHFGLRIVSTHRELLGQVKAEKWMRLTSGTSLERIGDESVTCADSGFVRPNIWSGSATTAPDAESPVLSLQQFGSQPLTFDGLPMALSALTEQTYGFVRISEAEMNCRRPVSGRFG